MRRTIGQVVVGGTMVLLIGLVGLTYRGQTQARQMWREAVMAQQSLELRLAQALSDIEHVSEALQQEQERSRSLAQAFAQQQVAAEATNANLQERTSAFHELQVRFVTTQQQLEQLQRELAMALQRQGLGTIPQAAAPVQLERIVVADGGTTTPFQGRVLSVHPDWQFVVIDLGWDAVKIGDVVSIVRQQTLLAKARVERVQANVAAATVLPQWQTADVHVNDTVQAL